MPRVGLIDHVTIDTDGSPIDVDATVSESHTFEAEVSSYPIENGSEIVDNVRIKPTMISLDCIVSDTPMDGVVRLDGNTPSTQTYLKLQKLFLAKNPFVVETSLDRFENMVMVSLSVPRSADIGYAISFKIDLQQVIIIDNIRTTVNVPNRNGGPKGIGPYLQVFSRLQADRAKYDGYQLILTDKTGPDGSTGGATWDHYTVEQQFSVNGGEEVLNIVNAAITKVIADGYVTSRDNKYHAFAAPTGPLGEFFSDVTGITYDEKNGVWRGDDGKPVVSTPSKVTEGSSADKLQERWNNIMAGDD